MLTNIAAAITHSFMSQTKCCTSKTGNLSIKCLNHPSFNKIPIFGTRCIQMWIWLSITGSKHLLSYTALYNDFWPI